MMLQGLGHSFFARSIAILLAVVTIFVVVIFVVTIFVVTQQRVCELLRHPPCGYESL